MRTWGRATRVMRCGGCGRKIELGALVQRLEIGRVNKFRGECCVGQGPPEVPALVKRAEIVPFVATRFRADMLPLDWRRRASGDREPGEEG